MTVDRLPKALLATDLELKAAQSVNHLHDLASTKPHTYATAYSTALRALVNERQRQAHLDKAVPLSPERRELSRVQPLVTKLALQEFADDGYTSPQTPSILFHNLAERAYTNGVQIFLSDIGKYRALADADYATLENRLLYVSPPGITPTAYKSKLKKDRENDAKIGIDTISFINFMEPPSSRAEWLLGPAGLRLAIEYYNDLLIYASDLTELSAEVE